MSTLSVRLRELRGDSSQAEMAKSIGIPQQAWARYEKGVVAPGATTLSDICRVHACSADWLLGLDDKRSHRENVSVRAASGGIAIGGVGNRVSGTIVASGDAGHAPMCAKCPYRKWGEKLRKQGLVIPGVDGK